MITLKENSIHSKIYKWFYNTDELPNSLCPYFWKSIVSIILGIPYFIYLIPYIIMKKYEDEERNTLSASVWIVLIIITDMIYGGFCIFIEQIRIPILTEFGIILFMTAILILIIYSINRICNYFSERKTKKEKTSSSLKVKKEYNKGKYEKYYHSIKWIK